MRYLPFLLIFINSVSKAQSDSLFRISIEVISDTSLFKTEQDFKRSDSLFFEDEFYKVRKTCSGEWGGTIWFKNKITNVEYACEATCPVIVHKIPGKYIVTSSLAHLYGFSKIIEIADPSKMEKFKLPQPRNKKGDTVVYIIGDDESKSSRGTNILLDSVGVVTLCSFLYEGQFFYFVSDGQNTYIAKIVNEKFVPLQSLNELDFWLRTPYNTECFMTEDAHMILLLKNEKLRGYVDIFENRINFVRYQ